MRAIGIIPARYASSRFPGKPLALINGKTMVRRVYEQACLSEKLSFVVVATDDRRIADEIEKFSGNVVLTSTSHKTGTERCAQALEKVNDKFDVVINIQGDEPFIDPSQINDLVDTFSDQNADIATLAVPLYDPAVLENPNVVKVVCAKNGKALYFSRCPIPFVRNSKNVAVAEQHHFLKHLGIYGYRTDVLKQIVLLDESPLELAESLEQLRWLENGFSIFVRHTDKENIAIDTPEDLKKIFNT
jgi:3-deoxy-manno-octulosonate cytidylyltransferase (CMP-KDO synthetase)